MRTSRNGYRPRSELYRNSVAVVAGIGLAATAAACGATAKHNVSDAPKTGSDNVPTETGACIPVLENGAKPPKLRPPSSQHNQWVSPQQEIDMETSVEAYKHAVEVANVVINLPLTPEAVGHFRSAPLDTAPYDDFDIDHLMWSAGQEDSPVEQYYLQINYPFCVNVDGQDWLAINFNRVMPDYDHGALSPESVSDYASSQIWIKPSDIDKIAGVKMYTNKVVGDSSVVRGHYDRPKESWEEGTGSGIHFKNIYDDYYQALAAEPRIITDATMKKPDVKIITNLEQYLAGR